jgi:hypothetical protein
VGDSFARVRVRVLAHRCSLPENPMPSDIHATSTTEPAAYHAFGLRAKWSEQAVTAAAVGLAVLVVTLIAVLMGMA